MASTSLKPVLTYTGLVDDFAMNHGDACIRTLPELNSHLVSAVLVGHPLLINDGHLIMHPAIREAILKPESSPLQHLVTTGYVKILTRNGGDLETLADRMADEGITSAQRLGIQENYRTRYVPALHVWMSQLRLGEPQSYLHPWPELNTSSIFHKVALAAIQSIRRSLSAAKLKDELEALRRFRDAFESGQLHRRTDWENIADRLKRGGKLSAALHQELMHAGNEAYQYSWGCALARKDSLVRVETRVPKFTNLDMSIGEPKASGRSPVDIYAPNYKVTHRKIGDNWRKLAEVARHGTETYYAKVEFQRCLDEYYRTTATEVDRGVMDAAAKKYSKALADHFRRDERAHLVYGYVAAVAGAAMGIPTAPLGLALGTGIGVAVVSGHCRGGSGRSPAGDDEDHEQNRQEVDRGRSARFDTEDDVELPDRPEGSRQVPTWGARVRTVVRLPGGWSGERGRWPSVSGRLLTRLMQRPGASWRQ